MRYALMNGSTITNVIEAEQGFAATLTGAIRVDNISPEPGIGWSTPDGGTTWEQPAPVPDPMAPARAGIAGLLAQVPDFQTQIASDLESVSNWSAMAAADQAAVMERLVGSFGTVMQAIQDHLVLTGHAPTAQSSPSS